ncbi:MAG: HepT-like ribonuclease domain-containing protein [Anaerolineae bacterium]
MPRSHKLYLTDIQTAIARIHALMQTLDEAAFKQRDVQTDGILFNLMTIGEAAKNIPPDIRALMPDIEWNEIGRFRDFIAHHYFNLDMRKVWQIVQTDLPELNQQIATLLELLKDKDHG